jgi:aspartate-semialdehyde dehydrogenase
VIATYQSASGAGARAMEDLEVQTRDYLEGRPVVPRVLRHPFAFNLFSHDSAIEDNGYNGEENKVGAEIRKILGRPDLGISTTCVRVPVLRAHSAAVNIELERAVAPEEAREALAAAAGVKVVADWSKNHFPMPNEASGADDALVAPPDPSTTGPSTSRLWRPALARRSTPCRSPGAVSMTGRAVDPGAPSRLLKNRRARWFRNGKRA